MSLISDVQAGLQQAAADLILYADYAEVGDVERAKKYATALRRYIVGPEDVSYGGGQGERVRLTKKEAMDLLGKVNTWIATIKNASAHHMYFSMKHFRD